MAGITELGTTYNLPNYTGVLHALTPAETPFFSAIGGLNGGGQTTSVEFEWEQYDLRAAAQNVALEGAEAPTEQSRVRAAVTNICQIHQETVGVSYTKLGAVGQKSGLNNGAVNPVTNEYDWQVTQMLKQINRDIEWSFINGTYVKPGNNSSARKTRGLFEAISTNNVNAGTPVAVTLTAATNLAGATSHGFVAGDQVVFDTIATTTGLSADRVYYVIAAGLTANAFAVSETKGGSAVDMATGDGTANATKCVAFSVTGLENLLQTVFDNGGIADASYATVMVNSSQKRAITKAYADQYGKFQETSRNVGGVAMTTLVSDFGSLNVMLNRHVPQHKLAVVSLEMCRPVYLEVPGKGHFFVEPLAKTGAKDRAQVYGEVGLAYGHEKAHGALVNLAY